MKRCAIALLVAMTAACAPQDEATEAASEGAASDPMTEEVSLGPTDGFDLPPVDLDRVQEGEMAPDFTLTSLAGPPVTLSDFRGEANVVLVFYRGHW